MENEVLIPFQSGLWVEVAALSEGEGFAVS